MTRKLKNELVMEYAIEETGNAEQPYILHGTRGGVYFLHLCMGAVHSFYVKNLSGNVCALKGNYKFSDNDSELVPVS